MASISPWFSTAAHGVVQLGHVQGAGGAVEQADRRQEQDGGDQVDGRVLDRAVELRLLAAERDQRERGDQHHLEPDVEVEQVAGEEGAADAAQQDMVEGVEAEALPLLVDVGQGDRRRRAAR